MGIILSISATTPSKENTSFIEAIEKLLIPYQILSLIKIPLAGLELAKNTLYVIKAPKHLKLFPALKILSAMGSVMDGFVSVIGVAKFFGSPGLTAVSAALAPVGGASVVLQLSRGGISVWSLFRVHRQWNKFEHLLGRKEDAKHEPSEEECKAAFDFLTKEWKTGTKTYDYKFFGLFKKPIQKKIAQIYDRFQAGTIDREKLGTAIKALKNRYIHKQVQHALQIALMIIGAIGTLVLIFAPTPVAPVAWGLLAISGVLTLAFYLYKYLQKNQFKHNLNQIAQKL